MDETIALDTNLKNFVIMKLQSDIRDKDEQIARLLRVIEELRRDALPEVIDYD